MRISAPQRIVAVSSVLLLVLTLWSDVTQGRTGYQFVIPLLAIFGCVVLTIGLLMKWISGRCQLHSDIYKLISLAVWWLFAGELYILIGGISFNIVLIAPGFIMWCISLYFLVKTIALAICQCRNRKRTSAA